MLHRIYSLITKPFYFIISINFYKNFVGENKLFFDIGANIGNRTKFFNRLGVKVVAVEPQPDCADKLEKKFAGRDVVVVRKGVGREAGEMQMSVCENQSGLSTFSDKWQTGRFKNFNFDKKIIVQMTTIDKLIEEFGLPDFCKIDVEGFELEALNGLTKKVGCLNLEFTSEFFDQAVRCVERLEGIGFSEFNFTLGEKPKLILGRWVNKNSLLAELHDRIKDNPDTWGDIYAR
ncbi:MAG: FkbM family methyltransferase [Patescibacteria group bacterium]